MGRSEESQEALRGIEKSGVLVIEGWSGRIPNLQASLPLFPSFFHHGR
jgi:hypothetical protein